MAAKIEIEQITWDSPDVEVLEGFLVALAEHQGQPTGIRSNLSSTLRSAQDEQHVVSLGAYLGGRLLGGLIGWWEVSTFRGALRLHLDQLFVSPDARGRGLGEQLMARAARLCCERGGQTAQWWCLKSNEVAIEFYERLGATSDSRVRRFESDPRRGGPGGPLRSAVVVRSAGEGDLAHFQAALGRAASEAGLSLEGLPASCAHLLGRRAPRLFARVATVERRLAGLLTYHLVPDLKNGGSALAIEDLWVAPELRREGVAASLAGSASQHLGRTGGRRARAVAANPKSWAVLGRFGAVLGDWVLFQLEGSRLEEAAGLDSAFHLG